MPRRERRRKNAAKGFDKRSYRYYNIRKTWGEWQGREATYGMESVAVGMVLAFLGGACVAVCNAWISRAKWFKEGARLYACFFVRQTLNVAYLVGLYLLAPLLPWDTALLLLGGALGLTIPSFFLIRRLLRKSGRSAACAPEQHSSAGR